MREAAKLIGVPETTYRVVESEGIESECDLSIVFTCVGGRALSSFSSKGISVLFLRIVIKTVSWLCFQSAVECRHLP
jgi:hypothetical protein